MGSEQLKPCPWCTGRPYLSLAKEYRSIYGCHDCGRFGPVGETRDEALAKWNRRPIEDALRAENARLKVWVNDLQSGMYVNCVYCGHRYGPKGETPVSMADALKEHIENCPDHPMSALKIENARLKERNEAAQKLIKALEWVNEAREYEDDMQNPSTSYMEATSAVEAARRALELFRVVEPLEMKGE